MMAYAAFCRNIRQSDENPPGKEYELRLSPRKHCIMSGRALLLNWTKRVNVNVISHDCHQPLKPTYL